MVNLVTIDASVWLATILEEEGYQEIDQIILQKSLCAPDIILYEVANGLLSAMRGDKPRFKKKPFNDTLRLIMETSLHTVPIQSLWKESSRLVSRHDLTFYDAAYLACAIINNVPLFTFDKNLITAAQKERVALTHLS